MLKQRFITHVLSLYVRDGKGFEWICKLNEKTEKTCDKITAVFNGIGISSCRLALMSPVGLDSGTDSCSSDKLTSYTARLWPILGINKIIHLT